MDETERPVPGRSSPRQLLSFLAAATFAVPIGFLAWFEMGYLWFGLTGEDAPSFINAGACALAFGLAFTWPLYRGRRPAEVVQESCRLGIIVSVMLPVVTFAVLLLWQYTPPRRDLGMGGLMLYNLPFVALVLSSVLVIVFSCANRLAVRRMDRA